MAYLIRKRNCTYDQALEWARTARQCVNPNLAFRRQLKALAKELPAAEAEADASAPTPMPTPNGSPGTSPVREPAATAASASERRKEKKEKKEKRPNNHNGDKKEKSGSRRSRGPSVSADTVPNPLPLVPPAPPPPQQDTSAEFLSPARPDPPPPTARTLDGIVLEPAPSSEASLREQLTRELRTQLEAELNAKHQHARKQLEAELAAARKEREALQQQLARLQHQEPITILSDDNTPLLPGARTRRDDSDLCNFCRIC